MGVSDERGGGGERRGYIHVAANHKVPTVFTDIHNNEIFALKNKHFTIHKTFHAESPKGHELFVITKKFTR